MLPPWHRGTKVASLVALKWETILRYPGGPSVITGVLKNGCESRRGRGVMWEGLGELLVALKTASRALGCSCPGGHCPFSWKSSTLYSRQSLVPLTSASHVVVSTSNLFRACGGNPSVRFSQIPPFQTPCRVLPRHSPWPCGLDRDGPSGATRDGLCRVYSCFPYFERDLFLIHYLFASR